MSSITIYGLNTRGIAKIPGPSSSLRGVLDEYCLKNKLDASQMGLKFNSKPVDLSLPWRLLGIPSNARLEVYVSGSRDGIVDLAVQLPSGERHRMKVENKSTFLQILKQCESEKGENLTTQIAENGNYIQPVINVLNREFSSAQDLTTQSLSSLGVSAGDSLLLRVLMRQTDSNFESEIKHVISASEGEGSSSQTVTTQTMTQSQKEEAEILTSEINDSKMEAEAEASPVISEKAPALPADAERNLKVFCPSSRPIESQELPDEFFDATPSDLAAWQDRQKQSGADRGFTSRSAKLAAEEAKKRIYTQALIRIRFKNGIVIQGEFSPKETIGDVKTFVAKYLTNPTTEFFLYITPPIQKFTDAKKSLQELGLVPAALLNFDTKSKDVDLSVLLRSDIAQAAQEMQLESIPEAINAPPPPAVEKRPVVAPPAGAGASGSAATPRENWKEEKSAEPSAKVPKWLKMGKK